MNSFAPIHLSPELMATPHWSQYAGLWAIEERSLNAIMLLARSLDGGSISTRAVQQQQAMAPEIAGQGYVREQDVAVIDINGTMTKYGSSLSPQGSTLLARRSIRRAVADQAVNKLLLVWETPGGTIAGLEELCDDIRQAAQAKTVWSFCEDLCASAGYFGASQASKVYGNRMATIGSIGVMMAVEDWSKAYENEGVKVHVIKTGEHKGAGVEGSEVTVPHLAAWQQNINATFDIFGSQTRKSRGLSPAEWSQVATGRTWTAPHAQSLKLIDGVQSYDETLAKLIASTKAAPTKATAPRSANHTFHAISQVCPGADFGTADDSLFLVGAQMRGLSLEAIAAEWPEHRARVERSKTVATVEAVVRRSIAAPGVAAVNDNPAASEGGPDLSDPIEAWGHALDLLQEKLGSKSKAIAQLVKDNPELHRAYIAAFNRR